MNLFSPQKILTLAHFLSLMSMKFEKLVKPIFKSLKLKSFYSAFKYKREKRVIPFVPNVCFFYPLKTFENLMVFLGFQGVEKGCFGNKWIDARHRCH